jgi:hypothetical protein
MAANATIGKLNVLIGGSSKELDGVLGGVEKRLAGFSAKVSAPLNNITAGLTRLPSMILSPYTALAAGAGAIASQLVPLGQTLFKNFMPGGEVAAARAGVDQFFGGFEGGAQRGIDRMRHFQRESRRFGLSPQFIAGFEQLDDLDANATGPLLSKILDSQSKIRTDPAFAKSLQPFFRDVQALKGMNADEFFFAIADAMGRIGDQTGKIDLLSMFAGPELGPKGFFHFAGGSTAMKGAIGRASAGGAFTPADTADERALRQYERDLEQAKKDLENDQRLQKFARDRAYQKYQKDSGPLAWARYLDEANNLARVDPTTRTNVAREYLRKEGLLGKPAERVDTKALEQQRLEREKREAAARELEAAEKVRDDYFKSFRQGSLNRKYAPWEAALRGQEFFDKLKPDDQRRAMMKAAGFAAEQFSYDHRSPMERAREQFRNIASMPELSALDRGRGIRGVMGALGFDKIRMGGSAALIEAGSQAEASLLDSIRERDATSALQNDPAAMKEYLKQIAEAAERQNKADEKLGEQFADLAKAIEDTKVNVLRMGG